MSESKPRPVTKRPRQAKRCQQPLLSVLMLFSFSGINAQAQPDGSADPTKKTEITGAGITKPETADNQGASGKDTSKKTKPSPSRASDKPFKPTEKISEDFSVPFPVDI